MNARKHRLIKLLPFLAYALLVGAQVYATFFVEFQSDSSRYYRMVLFASLALSVLALPAACLIWRKKNLHSAKKAAIILCCVLLAFQAATLPITNLFSMTLPVWPPRGSVYEFPTMRDSVSLSELPLFLSYYLDGRKLTANAGDDPKDFDNGYLFLLDEYRFHAADTMVLSGQQAGHYAENPDYYKMTVLGDPKRKIPGFSVYLYQGDDFSSIKHLILFKDADSNWYLVPAAEDKAL